MKSFRLAMLLTVLINGLGMTGSVVAETVSLPMTQAASGNYTIHATLDSDVETELLLDTGSGYVSLSKQTFDRVTQVSSPRFSRHIYGTMANGRVEKVPLYFLSELRLSDNCVLKEIEVAVFPKADRDILGLNALTRMEPITLKLSPATLTSSGCVS